MIRFALAAVLAAQWLGGDERNTREGAEHLAAGRLEEALRAFSRAEGEFPEAPENDLNLAGVHYRMGERGEGEEPFAEAARGYRAALAGETEGTLRRDAFFNLGNALFRAGAFEEAAGAYGEAVALDPEDLEARRNLERALRRAEPEQQDQQEQDQQQDGAQQDPEPGDEETPPEGPPDEEPEANEPPPAGEPPPEITPEQADRILAALAEVEAAFHEAQIEKRRARALRRGRH